MGRHTGRFTTRILLNNLQRARRFRDAGREAAYRAQLLAFAIEVQVLAPQSMSQAAADALAREAKLLLKLL